MGQDDEGIGKQAPSTPTREQAACIDREIARRAGENLPEDVREQLLREVVHEETAGNRSTPEPLLTLTQAVDWFTTGRMPDPGEQRGPEIKTETPRQEVREIGEDQQQQMSLTQAMRLWEAEEEEVQRRSAEAVNVRRQVATFDLQGDRPYTIGVGQRTPEFAIDVE